MTVKVYFVWVGQGDCTLIQTSDNTLILIDCGTSDNMSIYTDNVKPTIQKVLKDAGNKKVIDYLILTHSDKDHCNLIQELLTFVTFDKVYYGGDPSQYKAVKIYLDDTDDYEDVRDITMHYYNMANKILDEADASLWIVSANYPYNNTPSTGILGRNNINKTFRQSKESRSIYDNNGNSLVLMLNSNNFQIAFLGDATMAQQRFILSNASSVLDSFNTNLTKLSHHGSPESYNDSFTNKALKPKGVSVSAGITFGHPSEEVINNIKTIQSTSLLHQYMVYVSNDDVNLDYDNEYISESSQKNVFNTNFDFGESSTTVPLKTTSGKKNKDPHAGEPYTELWGCNVVLSISGGTGTLSYGETVKILTTKSTRDVTSRTRKGRKRKRT